MTTEKRQILVTAALPYANGPIHLGHMVEHIQADIWVRFQRLKGNDCLFICGEDAHGTAIMIAAEKQGLPPEALVAKMHKEHARDLRGFLIEYDNFYTTHSPENRELAELIYTYLKDKGDIFAKTISQAYDPVKEIFLPDRFIRGTCPRCGAKDQYGDVCEICGATYSPTELIDPVSALSGAKPIEKNSEHFFFSLNCYTQLLKKWIDAGHLQPQVANKLKEWFSEDLKSWDISRDAPYFGFEIPHAANKYFYVWLDAPIGYMASLKNLSKQRPSVNFDAYWKEGSQTELYHFVGKDIVYFHALFWPAILSGAGFRLPTTIYVHGYLTVNGHKMSKSRGTFITAHHYLDYLSPEYLRYYYAAKLSAQVEDIDLNLDDFIQRVNADLIGKYVNLASRCASFIAKKFGGKLASELPKADLYASFLHAEQTITDHYESLNYSKAVRVIMSLADRANQYIDAKKPWELAKEINQEAQVQAVCTQGLNLFKILTTYLKPILPVTAKRVEQFLNCDELNFVNLKTPLLDHSINPFEPLMQRLLPETTARLAHE
ncbi:methionine--tRNA ligase [Coxiella endosymbiont of Ornithodoros amblus]|uniref:methionine--tRNA ligase n=1 Tax=Coxiella endosymbiont of Ornithodoros amblus TaxID=1656166 RepID=UPI00244DE920|nr:methionine--tRNA ligase [Coxiella endosymbiont of Ornithodoros amblus]MBW5802937.1 methionine--tRNA ligase [Coxiella endosymbiont of Ornithodoros amblus]